MRSIIILAWWPLLAHTQPLPPAPHREVHDLTAEPGYFTEPSIAVNPRDPGQVVAAFQDNAHISFSRDSGRHWQAATGIAPPNYRVSGDVSVTYDNRGHAIICYMAFDKLGRDSYWAYNATRNGLFVRRSLDGGATWEANHIPIVEHPSEPNIPWEDKPYIVADDTNGPFSGNLYVGWTRWTLSDSQILLARSTDGGLTWAPPVEINGRRGLPREKFCTRNMVGPVCRMSRTGAKVRPPSRENVNCSRSFEDQTAYSVPSPATAPAKPSIFVSSTQTREAAISQPR